jgi:hypothetical protein
MINRWHLLQLEIVVFLVCPAAGGSEYAGAAGQNLFVRSCRASVSVIGMNAMQTKQRNMEFSLIKPVN